MSQNTLIRQAILEAAAQLDQAQSTSTQQPGFTYVPPSHARALDPDATLVVGMRGSGKSFWWSRLASEPHRAFIHEGFPEAQLPTEIEVAHGFGTGTTIDQYPDSDTLLELCERYRPRAIWRAVVATHAGIGGGFPKQQSWEEKVRWVQTHAEGYAKELEAADLRLGNRSAKLLILFDALDRLADDWHHIRPLAKGLLQVALDMRSSQNIRCKVYVRPDMLDDDEIVSFPDYAKLKASTASLKWQRADLYALLFQCLGNTSVGAAEFRRLATDVLGSLPQRLTRAAWKLPPELRVDERQQEALFERLAGRAMGASTKRGKPYTWLVNHLQDGLEQVSPRSFFAALKTAAMEAGGDDGTSIDYRGIQRGVQQASEIRVTEITEDYPWVKWVMDPLYGNLTVPCTIREVDAIWKREGTLEALNEQLKRRGKTMKLPPQHIDQKTLGILTDLEGLGMLTRIDGKRIQMPDVYRVAFGFGRRGGVKPLR